MKKAISLETLSACKPGDSLCDMHEGFDLRDIPADCMDRVPVPVAMAEKLIRSAGKMNYLHKMLCVITSEENLVVCAYRYDSRAYILVFDLR